MAAYDRDRRTPVDWVVNALFQAVLAAARALPYAQRVALIGWLTRRVLAPLAGFRRRAMGHLAYIWPDLPEKRRADIADASLDNLGRSVIEQYSAPDLIARARHWQPHGAGWQAAEAARQAGRPILFVSGHFGNYQAFRSAMNQRGYHMGGLYRPMNNGYVNAHYEDTMRAFGGPAFPRGRRGVAQFLRHIKGGGQCAILLDQYFADGVRVDFLGKPAPTALTGAEMALRHDALVVPIFARRCENGLDFDILVDAPIPHDTAEAMTQAISDAISRRIRETPEQWLWVHRRWKPERQLRYFDLDPEEEEALRRDL
ncbi:lauroyl acyltransferase [Rhodobacterales bacterium LSUCC1028]|nr:lauroyl acyltransferase [Rhodobacterales bacterium LSUCC1028]